MTVKKIGLITGVMAAFLLAGPEAMAGPGTGKGGNGNGGNHGNDQGGGNGNGGGGGTGKGGNGNGGNGGNNNGGGGTGKGGNGNGGNGGTGKGGNGNGGNTPGGGEVVNHCDNRAGNTNKRRCRHKTRKRRYVVVDRKVVRVYRKRQRQVVRKRYRTVTAGWAPGYHCALDGAPVYNRKTCRRVHRLARRGQGYSFADNSGYASYITTGAAPRVVVRRRVVTQRRVVVRRKVVTQRRVVVRRKVVTQRRVVVRRPQVVYRQTPQTYVQGGYVYTQPGQQVIVVKRPRHRRRVVIQGQIPQYGNGVTVHYGPVITKQAPY